MAGLPNLAYTRSLSRYGLSQVTVVFEEGTDIYFARNLINARLGAIKSVLPPGLEPEMGPISTGLGEIFMYTVQAKADARMANGEPYTATDLREIQDWIIKPPLAQVKGVIEVNSIGGYNKQYHVMPAPAKLLIYKVREDDGRCKRIMTIAVPATSNATVNNCWCAHPASLARLRTLAM